MSHESHDRLNELVGPCNDKWIDEIEQHYFNQITQHGMKPREARQKIDEATWIPRRIQNHIKQAINTQIEQEKRRLDQLNRQIRKARGQVRRERIRLTRQRIHRGNHYYYIYRDRLGRFTKHK